MRLTDYLLYKLTARLPARLITIDGCAYLERYYLGQLWGATFYLHRFVSSDSERHLHNHPWRWGRAIVLSGGYDEERVADITTACPAGCLTEVRRVSWWNVVNGNTFHRVANAAPRTWTLFFHGERQRVHCGMVSRPKGWGFLSKLENDLVVFQPATSPANVRWWEKAPQGRDIGRRPLGAHK